MNLDIVALVAGAVPATLFVIFYHRWADWSRTHEGRHLMTFTSVVAALLCIGIISRVIGPFTGSRTVTGLLFLAIAILLWDRLYLLAKAQQKIRRVSRAREKRERDTK